MLATVRMTLASFIGKKTKRELKELTSFSFGGLLTAYTQLFEILVIALNYCSFSAFP